MIREFSAGGIVFNNKGQVLMTKHSSGGWWQFPKGHIEKGESSQEAAVREVKEEGGVNAKIIDKIGQTQYFRSQNSEKYFKTVTYFLMDYIDGDTDDHDWEVEEAVWMEPDEVLKRLTFKEDIEIFKKALELKNGQ